MFLSKYGVARIIEIPVIKRAVVDFALGADWTPAAGDVKITKDGGVTANVTNLPAALAMGNTALWSFSLTATEMQAARVVVTVADAATKAVEDQSFIIETYGHASGQHEFDLDTASQIVASVTGNVGGNVVGSVGSVTGAVGSVTGAVGSVTGAVGSVTGAVGSVTGAVGSVTGAVGSVTGNVGGNVVGTVASVVGNVAGNVVGSVASVTAGVTLAASAVQAIWDALTTALTTVGSIGKRLADNIDAAVSSRLATAGYTAPLDAAGTRSAVGLAAANLDTQIGDLPTNAELATALGTADDAVLAQVALVKAKTDSLTFTVAGQVDANIQYVNDTVVTGAGTAGSPWGP